MSYGNELFVNYKFKKDVRIEATTKLFNDFPTSACYHVCMCENITVRSIQSAIK